VIVRIEYHNGDWDLMEVGGDMLGLETSIRLKAHVIKGKIEGMETLVRVDSLRAVREWPDGL
jgi:hypothetical protein